MGRFVQIAMGSASEVDYLILLARDLDYLQQDNISQQPLNWTKSGEC
jgi:four helix bundle protein